VALVAVCFFGVRVWWGFLVAALVAYSRIYTGSHWPSDVATSIFVGLGSTFPSPRTCRADLANDGASLAAGGACGASEPARRMTARQRLFVFLGVLTVLRLVVASQIELFPDESYYFMWSERMDVSYFSKGPGVAAAIWLGTHLFGRE
jgi:hypothetical protein